MHHFKYVNIIRNPNGTLRDWNEHNFLCMVERNCDKQLCSDAAIEHKHKLIQDENRSRLQKSL